MAHEQLNLMDFPPEERVKEVNERLTNKEKEDFLPPVGMEIILGPFTYKVNFRAPGQLRFSADLIDIRLSTDPKPESKEESELDKEIEENNKEESRLILPGKEGLIL